MQIPIRILDIEGDGFHVMIQGKINGMEANFRIDTGASRSVFDIQSITQYIPHPRLVKKESMTAGIASSDFEIYTFIIDNLEIGDIALCPYEAVAVDLTEVHESYQKLGLPNISGIIGGDLLVKLKATINYRLKKIRLTKPRSVRRRSTYIPSANESTPNTTVVPSTDLSTQTCP